MASRLFSSIVLVIALIGACLAQPRGDLAGVGIDQKLGSQLPLDAKFFDDSGKEVALGSYFKDRTVILALVYYRCPSLCNAILNGILACSRVVKFDAGKDYDIVLVSIDPLENPGLASRKKASYVESYNRPTGSQGWHFLTGSKESIDKVAAAVGYRYKYDEVTKLFVHSAAIQICTPKGIVSKYFYETDYPPRDVQFALMEASENRIGSLVDKFVLQYCFVYDPATGKYSVAILNIIRGLALLTAVLLGGFIFLMLRRERARRQGPPISEAPQG